MKRLVLGNPKDITLAECFKNYVNRCKARNLSEKTITTYTVHFGIFCNFIDDDDFLASMVNEQLISDFTIYLRENTRCNDTSVVSYLRSIRVIINYGIETGAIEPFKFIMPKADKKIKETYSDAELAALLKKPNLKKCNFTEYKMWVFVNFLLATGVRISSALNVQLKDLDFDSGTIHIRKTKNRKSQIIPMANALTPILREFLGYRKGGMEDYLFCSACGLQADLHTYQDALVVYNNRRGVMKTSAHLFRHTFAKKWILNNGDIFRLQKVLGHSSLDIVKEYVNMFSTDLQKDFDKFNPLDSLNKKTGGERITM